LLIKPSALGDIVHSLPVLSALRRRYPTAHLSWLVNRSYEPLIAGHPDLDATLIFDRGALKAGRLSALRSIASLWRTLRRGRFDLVIDLQGLLRSGLMTRATRAAPRPQSKPRLRVTAGPSRSTRGLVAQRWRELPSSARCSNSCRRSS